ncbi:DUF1542 domain-containing protein [Staphylococcus haemolyticus]|nr:DUF1542 domain-containing protein [Staphylococcus haemolyticus]MBF2773342.1 DUF1542 domain-containing protein [Staphylococcus haemolyticus]MBF2776921.1 DUF1542 domain-containing protein [Staphylococcus haemolyticus]MBF2815174.1 DUF1542 domain-containing protein [Staphylococcus haemolyticus]MBF9721308.1 DUF1542 domain-containing protein [Staphylococcus haemolyticus]
MNLFKKQKFSIRKFSVGIFSTVIATLTFFSHPGHAATQEEESNSSQITSQRVNSQNENKSNISDKQINTLRTINTNETATTNHGEATTNNLDVNSNNEQLSDSEKNNSESISASNAALHSSSTVTNETINNVNKTNQVENEKPKHHRAKRSADSGAATANSDVMRNNEVNSNQFVNGTFTDTSNGAVIPTNATTSEMNDANKVTGWQVNNADQTQIPLIWGPKALPPYNPYVFNLTKNKVAAVLSKYTGNNTPDNDKTVGPIYQDIDVTPGSELQLEFIGTSMGNTNGINGVKVSIFDGNNPTDLLYSGRPNTAGKSFGVFRGVFNVPDNVTKLRFLFETFDKRSYESAGGSRLLKGSNNFGGSGLADVKLNSGAYLKATTYQTEYTSTSSSTTATQVDATLEVSIENKGHARSNKTQYKVTLPEGAKFVSATNARSNYNSATRELTLNIDRIDPGTTKDITYTVTLPASVPIKKDFEATLLYVTEGINMNRRNGSRDFGSSADDNYFRYGGTNIYIKSESDQKRGNTSINRQTVTVKMFKDALQQKVNEITTQLQQLNRRDYSSEAWSAMQNVLNQSRQVLDENDDTPISDRKSQANINDLTLQLDKERAKLEVDKVAKERQAIINANNDATLDEKEAALNVLKSNLRDKNNSIDESHTSDEVTQAKNIAIDAISASDVTPIVKQRAIQALESKANEKLVALENNTDATFEEREIAKTKVNEELINAKKEIGNATTNQEVDAIKTDSDNAINQVQTNAVMRNKMKQALERAIASKKAAIERNEEATEEEKLAVKNKIDEIANHARTNIERGVHNDDVTTAKNNAVNMISSVQVDAVKKAEAKSAIDEAARVKKATIDQVTNATDEEKVIEKAKIDEAALNAKNAIDNATTNTGVDMAKINGEDSINNIQPEVQKKDQANSALDEAVRIKKAEIDKITNATDEEKAAAKAKVDEAVTAAKNAIDHATNNAGVNTAKTNGITTINNVQPIVVKKDEAKAAIDEAARNKKNEIEQVPNATEEEKVAAKTKVEEAATIAKNAIDQATNNTDVDTAKSSGIDSINHVQTTVVKKDEAKAAIDNAATAKKEAIDQNTNATDEEKATAKAKVDAAVIAAKNAIDQATNNAGVDTAKSSGIDSINHVQMTVVKKDEAKAAIDNAATAKKEAIDQNTNATDEEKAAAKAKVDTAVTAAKNAIDQATNNAGVDTAKSSGTNSINQVQPTVVKKDEAKAAIEEAATAKKEEINRTPNATDEEKATAKARVDKAVKVAKNAIDQATNNQGVDTAKESGIETINQVQATVVKKAEAKTSIDEAATAKKAEIDRNANATEEEKIAAKAKVDDVTRLAKVAIDQATNNQGVDTAKSSGIDSINHVQPAVEKKEQAKAAIDNATTAKKAEIDQNANATEEEKVAAKVKVDEAAKVAKSAIDQATNNVGVDVAKESGIESINNIQPTVEKKDQAKAAIDNAATAKKVAIEQNTTATDEEKADAIAKVEAAVTVAKNAIDQATNNTGVDSAKQSGIESINQIQPTVVKKDEAKAAIDGAATAKKEAIDQNTNATNEEKVAAKAKVDEATKTAKSAIDQATNNGGVEAAKESGIESINNIQPTVEKKDQAKAAINNAATAKKAEIDQNANATEEEKSAAKLKIDKVVASAKRKVEQSTSNDEVETAKNNGVDLINHVQPTVVKKAQAKVLIDEAADIKKEEIDRNTNATEEEKVAAKAKVDEAAKVAKNAIDQATNNASVGTAKATGVEAINQVQPTVVKKAESKAEIDNIAQAKKAEIDQNANATEEEKVAAKAKVDEVATAAKQAIDQATNNQGVDTAKESGIDSINHVQPSVVKKDLAKAAIEEAATAKKTEIDHNSNATEEEKVAAKAKVDEAAKVAKNAIDQATNNAGVDTAKESGIDSINQIQPTVVKKAESKAEIDSAVQAKKAEIDQNATATEEEKAAAKEKVNEAAKVAKNAIDQTTNNADVERVKEKGIDSINQIQPTIIKKSQSKALIDEVADSKKAEIDENTNATEEEKTAAKAKVDEFATNAKSEIDQATNNSGVDAARLKGIDSINQFQPTTVKKDQAKVEIDNVAQSKKAEIDQNANATEEEKSAAKAKIDKAVKIAKRKIDQATNNAEVEEAKNNGVGLINQFQPTVIKKSQSKALIDEVTDSKKEEIDQNITATEEEKAAAKAKVDEIAMAAKKAIDQATNNAGVDVAKESGIESINHVQPAVVKKDEAKASIDEAATAKKAEIDQNANATEEEKVAAKAKVDEATTVAKNAIDQATNNAGVDAAKESGIESINQVQPAVVKKDEAKASIDEAATAKKAEIDHNVNATEEEKSAAKAKVDEAATAAKQAIDKAVNNSEVDNAIDVGKTAINNIEADNSAKSKAIKHLQELVKQQMTKIDSNHLATEEEKAKAKQMIKLLFEKAKIEIEKAKTSYKVKKIDAEYSKLITKTVPENKAKLIAKKKIEKIARQLKNKINNMNGVSNEEKVRIKVIIEQIVKKSFKDIDLASRNNTINKIVNDVKLQFANIKINKQNNKKSLSNNENASVIVTTEQHKTNKAYHKVRNEKGRYQLPNTGINNDKSSPLISFTFVSGLFLILRSMRRRASK